MNLGKALRRAPRYLGNRGLLNWMSDKAYLKLLYRSIVGKPLNLDEPRTFNEKLQWLKLYDRRPAYTEMVDKYGVKAYVAEKIGEEYIIPTLGVWDTFEDVDFDALPQQFVLKCTHDSGGVMVCTDKAKLDKEAVRKDFTWRLHKNFYSMGREWPYKNVKPRILAEQFLVDESGGLKDYKIFCFHGKPKLIMTVSGGHTDEKQTRRRMYDTAWNLLPVGLHGKPAETQAEVPPSTLSKMLELAEKLSAGTKFLRVDLYDTMGHIYFGELTFYHQSGYETFSPESFNLQMGDWIDLTQEEQ